MSKIEYKIEKNVPITRRAGSHFDDTQPEYVAMAKMKIGESFEFPRSRVNNVLNTRMYLKKHQPSLTFSTTSGDAFRKDPKKQTGRIWRVEDNSRVKRRKPKKR